MLEYNRNLTSARKSTLIVGVYVAVTIGLSHQITTEIDYEMNINYNSVVALTSYFLPHLLKLGVSHLPSLAPYHDPVD
jgi:hypothetical protein